MSAREDRFYEIFDTVQSKGIKDQFDEQLQKMNYQPKHSNKDMLERWEYASNKVIQNHRLTGDT